MEEAFAPAGGRLSAVGAPADANLGEAQAWRSVASRMKVKTTSGQTPSCAGMCLGWRCQEEAALPTSPRSLGCCLSLQCRYSTTTAQAS